MYGKVCTTKPTEMHVIVAPSNEFVGSPNQVSIAVHVFVATVHCATCTLLLNNLDKLFSAPITRKNGSIELTICVCMYH